MSNLSNAVAAIRFFLESPLSQPDARLREAAQTYADAWRQTAARLRRIHEFQDAGLSWEAVHLAEAYPPVMELCGHFFWGGEEEWRQQAEMNELPAPDTTLTVGMFQKVNDAYMAVDAIKPMMERYHRSILARAPLLERMAALREVAAAAPDTSLWAEELKRLEAIRLRELEAMAAKAIPAEDIPVLLWLNHELFSTPWSTAPDAELTRQVREARERISRKALFKRYAEVSDAVEEAFANKDEERVTRGRHVWDEITRRTGPPPPDIAARVQIPFGWAAGKAKQREKSVRFANGLTDLTKRVNAFPVGNPATLERELSELEAIGGTIPDALKQAIRKLREDYNANTRQKAGKWRLLSKIGKTGKVVLLLTLAAILALAGWWIWR